jgi:hypothetical protein
MIRFLKNIYRKTVEINRYGIINFNGVIQGVSEIGALILTGNRTHQKEQLFSLPFALRNGLKKSERFS